ncbi:radical SAM protein [Aromatoleum anaerobium]|uniref:Radical SAM protein n=1 Tax=Aromatoleum anaerobium TaxID=182180 RepID=A0ABX1PPD8_9RHOO|nr:radical SAM protein [Aromatoleum anaerobium]MCK0508427.1 radical SAM protein [Aromatoleum anaerobium]
MLKRYITELQKRFSKNHFNRNAVLRTELFDPQYYLEAYPDIRNAGIDPLTHFIDHGAWEGRNPCRYFDMSYYLDQYPELAKNRSHPLADYIRYSVKKCRKPNAFFNADFYLNFYPEIKKSGQSPLEHFISQLRSASISVNTIINHATGNSEYNIVAKKLIEEILYTYRTYLFREPTSHEILSCINNFYKKLPSFDLRVKTVNENDIRKHLNIRPFNLEMDIVNVCNIKCIMCHFSSSEAGTIKKKEISVEDFHRVAKQIFPLCAEMSLSFGAEPLLHKKLGELLDIIRDYSIPTVRMYTNGLLLHDKIIETLIQSKLDQICISLDGATKETYEYIRSGAKFDTLISNIKKLNDAKERHGSLKPYIGLTVVIMRSNIEELPQIIRLASKLKAQAVGVVHVVPQSAAKMDWEMESLELHKELCNKMLDEAKALADEYGIATFFPEKFHTVRGLDTIEGMNKHSAHTSIKSMTLEFSNNDETTLKPSCLFPWHFVGLQPNGHLIPCGWWFNESSFGNVLNESFEAIWLGQNYINLRSEIMNNSLRETCRTCPAAGMGKVDDVSAFQVK